MTRDCDWDSGPIDGGARRDQSRPMDDASHAFEALIEAHIAADSSPQARVRRVVSAILDDPAGPHDVRSLAERAAMSPRTLSRAFRRATGTSPARFVEDARLRLARLLLERGGVRVP